MGTPHRDSLDRGVVAFQDSDLCRVVWPDKPSAMRSESNVMSALRTGFLMVAHDTLAVEVGQIHVYPGKAPADYSLA